MNRVILYSGGLDSFIASKLIPDAILLHIDLRTRYADKEIAHLGPDVRVVAGPQLTTIEREDGFVPQRNVLLVTQAQAMTDADEVLLCAVAGEYSRDKHKRFFKSMSSLLSYTAQKPVRVYSPLHKMTKTEAVRAYLECGGDPDALRATLSCYDSSLIRCGRCMSCFRRWVALENNGIIETYDGEKPWEWIKTHRAPWTQFFSLPLSEWEPFLRAQLDVLSAYRRLHGRQKHG
jgi:7-cyano-7-deazaguanine synthase in queuosine biosynthesis